MRANKNKQEDVWIKQNKKIRHNTFLSLKAPEALRISITVLVLPLRKRRRKKILFTKVRNRRENTKESKIIGAQT